MAAFTFQFMKTLPDPRAYTAISSNPLVAAAEQAAKQGSALQQGDAGKALISRVQGALALGDDALIERALDEATSRTVHATLTRALEAALEPNEETALTMRVFAIPLLIVTGGRDVAVVPGVVPDVGELQKLFENHGALGQAKNFGLGNALTSAQRLEAVKPSMLYRMTRGLGEEGFRTYDLPPEDIEVQTSEESVHLRFLAGASVTPGNAPGFVETAGNIGAWGLPFTKALTVQIGQEGLSLLSIPRPPMNFPRALEAGRFALRELGFQLFLSNALRKFRARVGEPEVNVASYSDSTVRVSLSSPFDASLLDEYVWPLYPGDDLVAVSAAFFSLLAECRLENVQVAETVWLAKAAAH